MGIKEDPSKPGTFVVCYSKRDPVTRLPRNLRRKGFKSLSEAKRAYAQMILDVEDKLRRKKVPDWQAGTEAFLESCREKGLTEKTIEDYGLTIRAHTFELWTDRLVDSITTEEIRVLIKQRLGSKSASSQKGLLKLVRGVFNFALESGWISRNPSPHLNFKVGDKIRRVLTQTQAGLLLDRAREMDIDWYPHWATAIYTGMRNGELYALTWDKVDLVDQKILVDTSWNPIDGFKSTKSGDDRIVDIAPPLLTLLKRWKLERTDSVYVLPRLTKWDVGEQARELRMFLMGIGLEPVRFHDLRATWATMMLSKGVEPIKVMTMGGWKDIKTMMIYARKAGVDIKGVANVLSDFHNPSKETGKVLKIGSRSES